jgi:hypothetical protein
VFAVDGLLSSLRMLPETTDPSEAPGPQFCGDTSQLSG